MKSLISPGVLKNRMGILSTTRATNGTSIQSAAMSASSLAVDLVFVLIPSPFDVTALQPYNPTQTRDTVKGYDRRSNGLVAGAIKHRAKTRAVGTLQLLSSTSVAYRG